MSFEDTVHSFVTLNTTRARPKIFKKVGKKEVS